MRIIDADELFDKVMESLHSNNHTGAARTYHRQEHAHFGAMISRAKTIKGELMKWNSCKNELPEEGINVIVAWRNTVDESDTFVGVAMRVDGVWYWYPLSSHFLSAIDKDVEITHWMPLPKAPEVKST